MSTDAWCLPGTKTQGKTVIIALLLVAAIGTYLGTSTYDNVADNGAYQRGYNEGFALGNSTGYANGWTVGNATGYGEGWVDGNSTGYANGWTVGNATGYGEGWVDGNSTGYNAGWLDGNASGYIDGFTAGYDAGYDIGYTDGYDDGFSDGWNAFYTMYHRYSRDITPTIDGSADDFESEWLNASSIIPYYMRVDTWMGDVSGDNYIYAGQDEDNLYFLIDLPSQTSEKSSESITIALNNDNVFGNRDSTFNVGDFVNDGTEILTVWFNNYGNEYATFTTNDRYGSGNSYAFPIYNETVEWAHLSVGIDYQMRPWSDIYTPFYLETEHDEAAGFYVAGGSLDIDGANKTIINASIDLQQAFPYIPRADIDAALQLQDAISVNISMVAIDFNQIGGSGPEWFPGAEDNVNAYIEYYYEGSCYHETITLPRGSPSQGLNLVMDELSLPVALVNNGYLQFAIILDATGNDTVGLGMMLDYAAVNLDTYCDWQEVYTFASSINDFDVVAGFDYLNSDVEHRFWEIRIAKSDVEYLDTSALNIMVCGAGGLVRLGYDEESEFSTWSILVNPYTTEMNQDLPGLEYTILNTTPANSWNYLMVNLDATREFWLKDPTYGIVV